jgi:hypothetical protein
VSLTFHSALRKLNTEPSIGASHQISVHFGKAVSDKKIFRNLTNGKHPFSEFECKGEMDKAIAEVIHY